MAKKVKSKAQIEDEVRVHVEAEKRAHHCVEQLALAEKVTESELNDLLNLIMIQHYMDITEERSISKICGYPICSNKLPKEKKQQFHISLKQQKVYDMSERKFFCSDFCFKASKFIESQIPTAPIWLRSTTQRIRFLNKEKQVEVRVNKNGEVEDSSDDPVFESEKVEVTYDRFDEFEGKVLELDNTTKIPLKIQPKKVKALENKERELVESTEKLHLFLKQWLEGYNTVKKNITTKTTIDSGGEEMSGFQKKAFNFLSNNPDWADEAKLSENFKDKIRIKYDEQVTSYMPPVDSRSQVQLRKRIVKEKVHASFDKLQSTLGLNRSDLSRCDFYVFLNKLRYTRDNIVLKPKEWILVTLCLLKIHSYSDPDIAECYVERRDKLEDFLKKNNLPNVYKIDSICDCVLEEVQIKDIESEVNEVSDDDDDDEYGYNIFGQSGGGGGGDKNLSTICEYDNFEELD